MDWARNMRATENTSMPWQPAATEAGLPERHTPTRRVIITTGGERNRLSRWRHVMALDEKIDQEDGMMREDHHDNPRVAPGWVPANPQPAIRLA
jgi:hypothetical protein